VSFDLYLRMDEEIFIEDDDENDLFSIMIRAPFMFPLSDEYHDVFLFFFYFFYLFFAFPRIGCG